MRTKSIDFSNTLMSDKLQRLAESDTHNVVTQVQEVFADFQVINDDLFSLGVPSVIGLTRPITMWSVSDQQCFNRLTESIYSLVMASRANQPVLRYQKSSDICYRLAEKVTAKLGADPEFQQRMSKANPAASTTVLIVDRREDPLTPLLNQWTY